MSRLQRIVFLAEQKGFADNVAQPIDKAAARGVLEQLWPGRFVGE